MLENRGFSLVVVSLFLLPAQASHAFGTDDAGKTSVIISQSDGLVGDIRREDHRDDRRQDAAAQARLTLPRTTTGEVDETALLADLNAQFAAGVKEIQVGNAALSQQEVESHC